eukprot:4014-Heterococcus_DN1.PRE.1
MAFGESHMGKGPKLYAQLHNMICVTACTSVVVKQLQALTQPQRDHVGTVTQLVTLEKKIGDPFAARDRESLPLLRALISATTMRHSKTQYEAV